MDSRADAALAPPPHLSQDEAPRLVVHNIAWGTLCRLYAGRHHGRRAARADQQRLALRHLLVDELREVWPPRVRLAEAARHRRLLPGSRGAEDREHQLEGQPRCALRELRGEQVRQGGRPHHPHQAEPLQPSVLAGPALLHGAADRREHRGDADASGDKQHTGGVLQGDPRPVGSLHVHHRGGGGGQAPREVVEPARECELAHALHVQGRARVLRRTAQREGVPLVQRELREVHQHVHARRVHPRLPGPREGELGDQLRLRRPPEHWVERELRTQRLHPVHAHHLAGPQQPQDAVRGPEEHAGEDEVPGVGGVPQQRGHEDDGHVVRVPEELVALPPEPGKDAEAQERGPEDRRHHGHRPVVRGHRPPDRILRVPELRVEGEDVRRVPQLQEACEEEDHVPARRREEEDPQGDVHPQRRLPGEPGGGQDGRALGGGKQQQSQEHDRRHAEGPGCDLEGEPVELPIGVVHVVPRPIPNEEEEEDCKPNVQQPPAGRHGAQLPRQRPAEGRWELGREGGDEHHSLQEAVEQQRVREELDDDVLTPLPVYRHHQRARLLGLHDAVDAAGGGHEVLQGMERSTGRAAREALPSIGQYPAEQQRQRQGHEQRKGRGAPLPHLPTLRALQLRKQAEGWQVSAHSSPAATASINTATATSPPPAMAMKPEGSTVEGGAA
eukprot:CAMPEP_0204558356 /NCGR_PEP_ID=MMETSP0661-20131031/31028_1 /ASSEMBLY_ACC=CAM_ASM_000606 /TAXON_ID=109239 /ORGANISM="Alexandrium margalefi, Strain AMGDE01CS-322" /LENGTH=671 /DNA_ID=CAMNT_0051565533 /DNA_START=16 /DNA_END=2032 /DNA_ORIENTATION=+